MLVYFTTYSGESVAISTEHVILVTEVKNRATVKITLSDGGTTEVNGNMLDIVAQLNTAN